MSTQSSPMESRNRPGHLSEETASEGNARYAAYAMRLRTLIKATSRYLAYTSDVGEAFRPLTHPNVVRGAYAVSWAYLIGDVSYAGYMARKAPLGRQETERGFSENERIALVVTKRALFQGVASMALPAFTIHSIVKYSAPLFEKVKSTRVRSVGPTAAGLLVVPFLPYMFDHPVEVAVERAFDWIEDRLAESKQKRGALNAAQKSRTAVDDGPEESPDAKAGRREKDL